jgi:TetR/AcrR family transcriptional regulator, regulator of cefoperazone and chloramphenicol sensitivity
MLTMRSVDGAHWVEDLTAAARIRDTAMRLFPQRGYEATSIRTLAEEAGVSPALVVHHFGSKEGLRRACDQYVVERIRTIKGEAIANRTMTDSGFLAGAFEIAPPLMRYLGWALTSGSQEAAALFDEMVEESMRLLAMAEEQGYIRPTENPRARSAVLLSMQLGGLILAEHLERAAAIDPFTPQGVMAFSREMLDIFSGGLFDPDTAGQMREALARAAHENTVVHEHTAADENRKEPRDG